MSILSFHNKANPDSQEYNHQARCQPHQQEVVRCALLAICGEKRAHIGGSSSDKLVIIKLVTMQTS